ncbi:nostrin isoform X3 [Hemibagrus wyckioides]|uniref:nostrin isoform X3 n=1 Tax=Hemibagrus wyckioides TaxID=337641 RepID=UPI00266B8893|nr:nostrin isoform X3 [Hemibagrus wyckioides]
MKEPLSTCTYNLLYQDLKRFSKNGEYFCKELVTVFQQRQCCILRSELEISYAKRLQKLAGKLLSVSKTMTSNSTYNAWSLVSNEMFSSADAHRTLGQSLHQDAVVEIRQMLDEHTKRKRPLENAIEKSRKLVVNNWNEQLKAKKKLTALTREHEALFSFVEKNKHICTEKEKQKMLNRLSKSAELQVKADEDYFNMNLDSYQIRLKWENTLKSCYQIVQETEKQRIEALSNAVNKYNLHMCSYSQTLLHSQEQIEEAGRRVDVEKDIETLVESTCVTADDNKAEFLIVDYFEEEGKTIMEKERRRDALKAKLQRVQECILKTKKEKEGLEKMLGLDAENISHTSKKTLEEQEQLLEEYVLKLDLLEATYCKLNQSMMDLEGKPKPFHHFNDSITKFKEKEVEHSIVKLHRPVRIKSTAFRSRQSFRSSVIFKAPVKNGVDSQDSVPSVEASSRSAKYTRKHKSEIDRASPRSQEETRECAEFSSVGKCKALYDFSSEKKDELNIKEGDLLDILRKDHSGWWYGELNGKRGHFPYNYVEELPVLRMAKSSDA